VAVLFMLVLNIAISGSVLYLGIVGVKSKNKKYANEYFDVHLCRCVPAQVLLRRAR
jgi:hypothetical protein